jgi:hypothetical protein
MKTTGYINQNKLYRYLVLETKEKEELHFSALTKNYKKVLVFKKIIPFCINIWVVTIKHLQCKRRSWL